MDRASPEPPPPPRPSRAKTPRLRFWRRQPRPQCAVCLHIHRIRGLPPETNGKYICVGWRTNSDPDDCRKTSPVEVRDGNASVDEVLLRYCGSVEDVRSALKGTVVSVWSPGGCCMGRSFGVDLSEAAAVAPEKLNSGNGGKVMEFDLEGIYKGGVLSVGVFCRMLDDEYDDVEEEEEAINNKENEHAGKKQSKSNFKCFSCLPSFKNLRIRPPQSSSARQSPSARPHPALTPTDRSIRMQAHDLADEEEGEGFITIEKGVFPTCRPHHPPSDDLRNTDDEEYSEDPLLLDDGIELFDVEEVEDEFLRMLDPPRCLSLDLELNLDGLIKEAEMELSRAAQSWKRRVSGGVGERMEEEEHEELVTMKKRSWGESSSVSGCFNGFGSPF